MSRETLLDFFRDFAALRRDGFVYDNGYRTRTFSYLEIFNAAKAFAARLAHAQISKGEKVIFWSENRPEWVIAFWGCVLHGAVVVPVDYRASFEFLQKIKHIVQARLLLAGDEVSFESSSIEIPVWRLGNLTHDDFKLQVPPTGQETDDQETSEVEGIKGGIAETVTRDDVVEVIFTSGATAEPKGVIITHRNLLANLVPIETEMQKYREYARPFSPIRFLNLLPLSHLFGQAMAMFIPSMLPGTVVFMRGYNPKEILRQVKARRISVIVCVPKILDVLCDQILRINPGLRKWSGPRQHFVRRWWKHRKIHRMFGWKFWSFVVGAAPLDPELEEFWSRLGYLVVQGYGLTETAPIVSLNHPFKTRQGSVGQVMPGVEVKIASDGEILVRGENVTSGYFQAAAETVTAFEDGWFHTGDIGEFDAGGRLFVRGRKKEMIVTPEGLNVFPEDVERVLNSISGVRESAVVGMKSGNEERVHAVLVLESSGTKRIPWVHPAEVIRLANLRLAEPQRIRGVTVWPDQVLPRTEGTQKLKRQEIKTRIEKGESPRTPVESADPLSSILSKYAGNRPITPFTTLEELGLSSLERVELLMELEGRAHRNIDEEVFAKVQNIADLQELLKSPEVIPSADVVLPQERPWENLLVFPMWSRRWFVRIMRTLLQTILILPLTRMFAWIRVEGREQVQSWEGPVIFAANHQSHMDVSVILAALPRRWRARLSPAMSKQYFDAHFFPERHTRLEWFTNSLAYYLAVFFFNAFPLPQGESGVRGTLRFAGDLLENSFSILIFPEGKRTDAGEINHFQPGVGMMASRLDVPVIPVRLEGLERVLHRTWKMARPGRVRVIFGQPLRLAGDDYTALARRVEDAVKRLSTGN